ncbi:MAG: hypothetical protein J5565_03285 [Muribaculaceae bacterium]|nr:hypothetical protein [Muribaculaceae bacterium]
MRLRVVTYLAFVLGIAFALQASPVPAEPNFHGIDVSWYQKRIDWDVTARDKRVSFVFIKATEGGRIQDCNYRYNLENARRQGIKVGSYHFLRPETPVRLQFDNFFSRVRVNEQDLIPVIDIEDVPEMGVLWKPQQAREYLKGFADLVEKHYGCKPMIYTSNKFFVDYLGRAFSDYPLFIARYGPDEPTPQNGANWVLWQFTKTGRVDGIDHAVDLSRFNKGYNLSSIAFPKKRSGSKNKDKVTQKESKKNKTKPAERKEETKAEKAGKTVKASALTARVTDSVRPGKKRKKNGKQAEEKKETPKETKKENKKNQREKVEASKPETQNAAQKESQKVTKKKEKQTQKSDSTAGKKKAASTAKKAQKQKKQQSKSQKKRGKSKKK